MCRAVSGGLGEAMVWLVRLYQATLSPFIGRQCRFTPTCSEYFIEAVRRLGPLRGGCKGAWRVLRCNPCSRGGWDPVVDGGEQETGGQETRRGVPRPGRSSQRGARANPVKPDRSRP